MIEIRPATPKDASIIQQLAEAIWIPTYSPILSQEQIRYMLDHIYDLDSITTQIKDGNQTYLMLMVDGVTTGFAAYSVRAENPEIYKLHKLYCLTETKGKGYGKMLLQEVEKKVLAAGKNILELNVNKYNPAKGFYERMGYEVIYSEVIPIGPYIMDDYVMRKNLTANG
jgi:GNAT superfamily N-acetyltransferase